MNQPVRLTRPVDKLAVVDDAIRNLDILKIDETSFILRDTQHSFGDNRASDVNIWLDRGEMIALRDRVDQMLQGKVKPTRRSA
jgi:hypothetical protein